MKYLQVAALFYLLITISCCNNKIPAPQGDIGFLNLQEKVIISPQLEKAGQYNQGKVLGRSGKFYYVFDHKGKIIDRFELDLGFCNLDLEDGKFWGYKKDQGIRTWYQFNQKGKVVFQKDCYFVWRMQEGRRPFQLSEHDQANNYGYLDEHNSVVIPPIYEAGNWFSDGLARVKKEGKWGYIDNKGNTIIPFLYEEAGDFNDGYAVALLDSMVYIYNTAGDVTGTINANYIYLAKFSEGVVAIDTGRSQYQFFDHTGQLLFDQTFRSIPGKFNNGYSRILHHDGAYFINKKGEKVSPIYKGVNHFKDGYAEVTTDKGRGILDSNFNFVIQPIYKSVGPVSEGFVLFIP